MSKTNTQKLQKLFEEYDIENTIAQLEQKDYEEFQKLAGKMLKYLEAR